MSILLCIWNVLGLTQRGAGEMIVDACVGIVLIDCRRTPPRFQFIVMNRRSTGECGCSPTMTEVGIWNKYYRVKDI